MVHPDAQPFLLTSTVFRRGELEVANYMVFGLAVSNAGTILAFAEARIDHRDEGAHHLVLRRSTDGGATWGPVLFIEESAGGECWANPAALVDRKTGRLFIFYVLNDRNLATQVFYRWSDDDGLTWSARREITPMLAATDELGWTVFMTGPGHGIQLRDGRLVLQLWGRREITHPVAERRYGNRVIYSDDHGATWEPGGTVPLDPVLGNNEARLVETERGALVLNARPAAFRGSGRRRRVASVSLDRGMSWSPPAFDGSLPELWPCDCGLIEWTGPEEEGPGERRTRRLFSTITKRRNDPDNTLEVSLSFDEGITWPVRRAVHRGPCNYSDMAVLPDRSVAVLFGAGSLPASPLHAEEALLVRFNAAWLTSGEEAPHA